MVEKLCTRDELSGFGEIADKIRMIPKFVDSSSDVLSVSYGYVCLSALDDDLGESDFIELTPEEKGLVTGNGSVSHGFNVAGNGFQTNANCGNHLGFKGCLNVKAHAVAGLDGVSHKGKISVHLVHRWCNKISCPVCFRHGYASRGARNIEARLNVAKKTHHDVEHIVASVPVSGLDYSYSKMKLLARKVLLSRGVTGGTMIFHHSRWNRSCRYWYYSPHFHVLGFISGGFSRCRGCVKACFSDCDGFKSSVKKFYPNDGWVVKVFGKRKSVFGTAVYQLDHASYIIGKVRGRVYTWFGDCSYRELKIPVDTPKVESKCPHCNGVLEPIVRTVNGTVLVVTDLSDINYKSSLWLPYSDSSGVLWISKPEVLAGGNSEFSGGDSY